MNKTFRILHSLVSAGILLGVENINFFLQLHSHLIYSAVVKKRETFISSTYFPSVFHFHFSSLQQYILYINSLSSICVVDDDDDDESEREECKQHTKIELIFKRKKSAINKMILVFGVFVM